MSSMLDSMMDITSRYANMSRAAENNSETSSSSSVRTLEEMQAAQKAKKDGSSNSTLSFEDMLLLMVTQLQNQTIDNTADTNDMMNQIIQMTVMQAITDMKSQVDDLTEANILNYTASLVGQTVTLPVYDKEGKLVGEKEGVVTGTGLYNGQRVIFVGNETYLLNQIMAVGKLPEKPEVEDPDKPGEGEGVDKPGEGEGVDKPGEGEGVDKPVEGGDETPGTDENGSGTDAAEETVEKALG